MALEFFKNFARFVVKKVKNATGKVHKIQIHLGKIIDKKNCIFKNRSDGVFQFNPETLTKTPVSEDIYKEKNVDSRSKKPSVVTCGGEILLRELLSTSGLDKVISKTFPDPTDADTCSCLVISNLLQIGSSRHIKNWAEGSILPYLYPNAKLTSQRISEFYTKAGTAAIESDFYVNYIEYLFKTCGINGYFNNDSTGVECATKNITEINFWNHDGDKGHGARISLCEHITGMPVFMHPFDGNINDVIAYSSTINRLKALNIPFENITSDCGYYSKKNIDEHYDENNILISNYIMKVKSNSNYLNEVAKKWNYVTNLEDNATTYCGKTYFVSCQKVMAGTKNDKPAYLYAIVDFEKFNSDCAELQKRYIDGKINQTEFVEKINRCGIFGIISGKKLTNHAIIYFYNLRLTIEQSFDISKNYAGLLPIRIHNDFTFHGKLLVWFMSLALFRIIQIMIKPLNIDMVTFFNNLRYQYAHVYTNTIVLDEKKSRVSEIYQQLKINLPDKIEIKYDNTLNYQHSNIPNIPEWSVIVKNYNPETLEEPKLNKKAKEKYEKKANRKSCNRELKSINTKSEAETHAKLGRKSGSLNKKTIARKNLINTLNKICEKKAAEEGITSEQIKDANTELGKKSDKNQGRKKGSKNINTKLYEAIESIAQERIDQLTADLSCNRDEALQTIISRNEDCNEAKDEINEYKAKGRPKGSYSKATLEARAVKILVIAIIVEFAEFLKISIDEFVNLFSGKISNSTCIEVYNNQTENLQKKQRGRRKGHLNTKTIERNAELEKGQVFLDKFQQEHNLHKEEVIKILWEENHLRVESSSVCSGRGRPKGSYGIKTMKKALVQAISSCIAKKGENIVYSRGMFVPFFEI